MQSSSPNSIPSQPKDSITSGYLNLDNHSLSDFQQPTHDGYLDDGIPSPPQLGQAEAAGFSTLSGFEVESGGGGGSTMVKRSSSSREGGSRGNSKPGSPGRLSPARLKNKEPSLLSSNELLGDNAGGRVNEENMSAWNTDLPSGAD